MISKEVISQVDTLIGNNQRYRRARKRAEPVRGRQEPKECSNAIVHCIVLKDRETETSEHLENCTGKDELKANLRVSSPKAGNGFYRRFRTEGGSSQK